MKSHSFEPIDGYLCLHLFEFRIAGDKMRLLLLCQGRGEAVSKRHLVLRLKAGGFMREVPISVNKLDSQLPQFMNPAVRFAFRSAAGKDVPNLSGVNYTHK